MMFYILDDGTLLLGKDDSRERKQDESVSGCLLRKSLTVNRALSLNIVITFPLELLGMDCLALEPAKGVSNYLV